VFIDHGNQVEVYFGSKRNNDCQKMVRITSKFYFSFFWLLNLICVAQLSSGNVRGLLVKRSKPLPGAPIKLQEISIERTAQNGQEDIDVDEVVATTLKRSRRSINPDFNPKITRVSAVLSHNVK